MKHEDIDHSGLTGVGGAVATDAIWDAAGDLAVGSGANTAAKLAAGSEGEVLTIASGVPSWEAAGGGGGVDPIYANPNMVPPVSAHAKDDEFLGDIATTGLDAKWSLITTATGMATDYRIGGGWLVIEPNTSGTSSTSKRGAWGFKQAAPTGDFTVSARVQDAYYSSDDSRPGIFIALNGGAAFIVGPDTGAANNLMVIQVTSFSATAEWSTNSGIYTQLSRTLAQGEGAHYRIRYDAAADIAYFEADARGIGTWTEINNKTSLTQPDWIGVCQYSVSAAHRADHKTAFSGFRVLDSI